MLMARRKHGKLAKLVKTGAITAEEAQKKIAGKYNGRTEVMAKRWAGAISYIPDRWASSVGALIGAEVDPSFKEALKTGVENAKDIYPKAIKDKGETLVKHWVEKLKKKVAG
jgi:hypothetical protein